jgi:hypothetical protein
VTRKRKPFESERQWVRSLQREIAAVHKRLGQQLQEIPVVDRASAEHYARVRDARVTAIREMERMIVDTRSRMPPYARVDGNVTYLEPVIEPIDPYEKV